jgi:hypothetical protein
MSLSNDNITIITRPSAINLAVSESTGDVDITTVPQVIKIQVGAILQTASGSFVIGETPSGLVNGSNAIFQSLFPFTPESLQVFVNGVSQALTIDYTTSGTQTINLSVSPILGDIIRINYKIG